jgi:uncharacterized protein YecE (DUF72 family)
MGRARLHIGTSGWVYRHWRGPFYPDEVRQREQLAYYASRFESVEVNGTFYRLARAEVCRTWREQTPEGFLFACKGSRFLTHMKRLKDSEEGIARFYEPLAELQDKLGPVVFQLPERFRPDPPRLAAFLDGQPKRQRIAFEFRNADWFRDDVLRVLKERDVALCLYDFAGRQSPLEVTAGFVYVRLHGPGGAYQGSYDDGALLRWARRLRAWQKSGLDAYCYFDNDAHAHAPRNAGTLRAMLARRPRARG